MVSNDKVLEIVGGFCRLFVCSGSKQRVECWEKILFRQVPYVFDGGMSVINFYVPTELARMVLENKKNASLAFKSKSYTIA